MEKTEILTQKITAVITWAETEAPANFDSTFVHDLNERLIEFGKLSIRQIEALDNIIDKFEIDVDAYL
jgi:hypothetical protein